MNNSKLVLLVICVFVAVFTAPLVTAAPCGGGGGWDWGYPYYGYPYGYGYYGSGDPYGYGYGYGYGGNQYGGDYGYGNAGNASHSRVAELQRRLARAGYYRGSVDGVL